MGWVPLFLLLISCPANGEMIAGRIVHVADRDTITVLTVDHQQRRIRIAGIDAPEKGQPFGERSRQNLSRRALGKDATLQCHKIDRYQRKVCKVMVQPSDCSICGHTLDVGLAQITVGLAWWYRAYAGCTDLQKPGAPPLNFPVVPKVRKPVERPRDYQLKSPYPRSRVEAPVTHGTRGGG